MFTFQFLNDKIYSYTVKSHLALGKIGGLINFITQKLKSKHLVCLSFLWWQFFWGKERKYFTHIPGLNSLSKSIEEKARKFCPFCTYCPIGLGYSNMPEIELLYYIIALINYSRLSFAEWPQLCCLHLVIFPSYCIDWQSKQKSK